MLGSFPFGVYEIYPGSNKVQSCPAGWGLSLFARTPRVIKNDTLYIQLRHDDISRP